MDVLTAYDLECTGILTKNCLFQFAIPIFEIFKPIIIKKLSSSFNLTRDSPFLRFPSKKKTAEYMYLENNHKHALSSHRYFQYQSQLI